MVRINDVVKITQGHRAWNPHMQRMVGKLVVVTGIMPYSHGGYRGQCIRFQGDMGFTWVDGYGHFIKIANSTVDNQFIPPGIDYMPAIGESGHEESFIDEFHNNDNLSMEKRYELFDRVVKSYL